MPAGELTIRATAMPADTTSLTIAAEAIARERNGEATTLVAKGSFKFVLIGEDGRPRALDQTHNTRPG